jgi:tRNA threonylcarbamoyladenosine biosynthesis protein TsaE
MGFELVIATAPDMEGLGARLAKGSRVVQLVYLRGALGTGKTTLVRGLLRAMGHTGVVRSPTFTLVEGYLLNGRQIYHLDLYRMVHPEELEFIGFRDYVKNNNLCLVEWAERGAAVLPLPDLDVQIRKSGHRRIVTLLSHTERGAKLLSGFA